jgi:nicotinate-nucleotide pyrophosphorylase (carboxylating)
MSWTVHSLIHAALEEDIGPGDLTSQYFVTTDAEDTARLFAKEPGVLAGVHIAAQVFEAYDPQLTTQVLKEDGTQLNPGDAVLHVTGRIRSLLTAERTALNFLQRLSGIATQTQCFVQAIAGTGARILDTRKTTPGWRMIEKAAVRAGGGTNHRFGLYDRVMIKDNHLLAEDGTDALRAAIARCQKDHPSVKIELEADTPAQVQRFLQLDDIDFLLLDNMSLEQLRTCVELVRQSGKNLALEASGGVNLTTVRAIAETGVDFISVGALTHSVKALDFSLELLDGSPA